MVTIACLKWGAKYPASWVNRLAKAVHRNLLLPHHFICYTDNPADVQCETAPLPLINTSGWWFKLWLFSLNQEMLFLDLDCVIVGDISPLVTFPGFCILKDPWQKGFNSSVMLLQRGLTNVWEEFLTKRPDKPGPNHLHGDQDWITKLLPHAMTFPEEWCLSYKVHVRKGVLAPETRIVYFHGRPKQDAVNEPWINQHWLGFPQAAVKR